MAWHFARGKLARDPAFLGLLERGLIPDNARILDLGCGQGLLASWLLSARALFEAGHWPTQWPAAPKPKAYRGVELMPRDVRRARRALGGRAEFVSADLRTADFGKSDAVVILDVLHYIEYSAQGDVLSRVRDALVPARGAADAGGKRHRRPPVQDLQLGRSPRGLHPRPSAFQTLLPLPARLAGLVAPAQLRRGVGADESRYALCQRAACWQDGPIPLHPKDLMSPEDHLASLAAHKTEALLFFFTLLQ
ncbi:MAG: hypothetical protein ACRD3I_04650, partial [Terriglobales bacterium]